MLYYLFYYFEVGENKKKDKKEEDSGTSQNQTNDPIDSTDDISNDVAVMETEKIDTK